LYGFVENEDERRTWGDFINPFDVVVVFFLGGDEACFWRGVVCVTLKKGKELGIVLYLCYFNGKWVKDLNVFCMSLFH
jgi:hypothetical protein